MNRELKQALVKHETDLDGTLHRFGGDEAFYMQCLVSFQADTTMLELDRAIKSEAWDDAFTAAHALKGLVGNMGFVGLFHATANIVILIRNGKISEVMPAYYRLKKDYNKLINVIEQYSNSEGSTNE